MLILTRRCKEEIVIDDQIRIKVLATSGGRVKVGVTAPSGIPIRRDLSNADFVLDCESVLVPETQAVLS